jgi:hypothetical protein
MLITMPVVYHSNLLQLATLTAQASPQTLGVCVVHSSAISLRLACLYTEPLCLLPTVCCRPVLLWWSTSS